LYEAADPAAWMEGVIRTFIDESPENSMRNEANEKAWGTPAVGFSSGADPLYPFYKEDIGGFFLTPVEWFKAAYPEMKVKDGLDPGSTARSATEHCGDTSSKSSKGWVIRRSHP